MFSCIGANLNYKKQTILVSFLFVMTLLFTHCDLAVKSTPSEIELISMGESTNNSSGTVTNDEQEAPNSISGKDFYTTKVLKEINKSCMLCHTPVVNNPIIEAPLSIISYTSSKTMLLDGTSKNSNKFYNKASNKISHTGGNQCSSGSGTICELIEQWWMIETRKSTPVTSISGEITSLSSNGKVYGWAGIPNSAEIVDVEFSINGQFIGETTANKTGYNGGLTGNRAFEFSIPTVFKDGGIYKLVAKLIYENTEIELKGSPYTFSLYELSDEGKIYFNQTLTPILAQRCSRCHAISSDQFFNSLITPKPNAGGSATNNEFVRMPLGNFNGKSHPGGNICGSIGNSPCKEIQEWWNREFLE